MILFEFFVPIAAFAAAAIGDVLLRGSERALDGRNGTRHD